MVLLSLLPGLTVSAQEQKTTAARTVIVVDQAGPVIGASVVIKGTYRAPRPMSMALQLSLVRTTPFSPYRM